MSGWNNQLMWSHYANSYAGICIEYDFNQIKDAIGFIYPAEYTTERPTLSLQDLGVKGFSLGSKVSVAAINQHIKKVYDDAELEPDSTIKKFLIVQKEGSRQVSREVAHSYLQMIIAVSIKVNNERAVQFRK